MQLPMKGRKEEARCCGLNDEHRRAQGRAEPRRQYEGESISDLIMLAIAALQAREVRLGHGAEGS